MVFNLKEAVIELLQNNPDVRFESSELAKRISEEKVDYFEKKKKDFFEKEQNKEKTEKDVIKQIQAEIGRYYPDLNKNSNIKIIEGWPRKFYYTGKTEEQEVIESEKDLYPLLCDYLWNGFSIYPKRINESRATNTKGRGGNKWLYPDVVGLQDLSENWTDVIKSCVNEHKTPKAKLWSFEVKNLINSSNLRESYFQAVSNSTWANYGYLVGAEIIDPGNELKILSNLYGIGLIRLNVENVLESQILIPAKHRDVVDWNIANRLVDQSPDFKEFIECLTQFYQTGVLHQQQSWSIPQ